MERLCKDEKKNVYEIKYFSLADGKSKDFTLLINPSKRNIIYY